MKHWKKTTLILVLGIFLDQYLEEERHRMCSLHIYNFPLKGVEYARDNSLLFKLFPGYAQKEYDRCAMHNENSPTFVSFFKKGSPPFEAEQRRIASIRARADAK